MNARRFARRIARWFALAGALVVLVTSLVGSGFQLGALAFATWALVPYGALVLLARIVSDGWVVGGAGAVMLAAEIGIRASVFLFPRGSTAAVALVFSPTFLGLVALPAGALGGWLMERAWGLGRTDVRAVSLGAAATVLGLVVVGFARPELLPWVVASRHAALARIGPPRVVTGADAFTSTIVAPPGAWYQTGDFDGRGHEEVAVIDHRGVALLDPGDFQIRERIEFGAAAGRLWNWYSKLARLDGRLVIVQTGGGFSQTEVREPDGRLVWRHRPDASLPPRALLPADLDADGRLEFYVAEGTSVARLDGEGREVWRATTPFAAGLALSGPRTDSAPAWVVSFLESSGITIRDATGAVLDTLPAGDGGPVSIGEWGDRRVVLTGTSRVRARSPQGGVLFEVPLGDFTFSEASSVRLSTAAKPYLAIVAATGRELHRWRIVILSPEESIVYDEIVDRSPHLLTVADTDGRETLLVAGEGLRAIRRRADR